MWYIGCFCRIFLNVKIPIEACISFKFAIILFSFHMHSLKSKKTMKSRKWKIPIFYSPFIQQQKQQRKKVWTNLLWKLGNSRIVSTTAFFIVDWIKWQKFLFTYSSYILTSHMSLLNFTQPYFCMRVAFWYSQWGTCHSKELQSPLCFCGAVLGEKKKE